MDKSTKAVLAVGAGAAAVGGLLWFRAKSAEAAVSVETTKKSGLGIKDAAKAACVAAALAKGIPPQLSSGICGGAAGIAVGGAKVLGKGAWKGTKVVGKGVGKGAKATAKGVKKVGKKIGKVFGLGDLETSRLAGLPWAQRPRQRRQRGSGAIGARALQRVRKRPCPGDDSCCSSLELAGRAYYEAALRGA
jgi:hypothetical protein